MIDLRAIGITESVIQFALVNAILGMSIYITLYTGMFSLANAGFMAIGAYTGVIMTQRLGLPLGVSVIGAMILPGLVAIPIGLPVLRLKDIYLAIATIGFGEVVRILILNFDPLVSGLLGTEIEITGGALGIKRIPKLTETWHLIVYLILLSYFVIRLHRSRFGRAMAAIRQDEKVAANMGINVVYVKTMVFVFSAMIAGAAGAWSGHLTRIISPTNYGFDQAVDILAFAVLGGTTTWVGPIVGGMILTMLPEVLRFANQYRGVINGLILLLVIVYLPGGVINPAGVRRLWARLRQRRAAPASAESGV
ncbi:MAG: branched-chain amino acid ABC transporter permease [Anaerolineae bacterium]